MVINIVNEATAVSCLPASCIYKNPFLPPPNPKLSNNPKIIINRAEFVKNLFFDSNIK